MSAVSRSRFRRRGRRSSPLLTSMQPLPLPRGRSRCARGRAFLRLKALDLFFHCDRFFPIYGRLRLKDLRGASRRCFAGPQGPPRLTDSRSCAISSMAGNDTPLPHAVPLQPCFSCRPRPQRLAGSGLRHGPWCPQRDECLSSADGVTVRDQNCPDDATLKVLNRLAARLGFDGAKKQSQRSRGERRLTRHQTENKAAAPAVPDQVTPRSRSQSVAAPIPDTAALANLDAIKCIFMRSRALRAEKACQCLLRIMARSVA